MTIKRVESSTSELRKIGRPGAGAVEAPPVGLGPVLRASWPFAWKMAKRFSQELTSDKTKELLGKLIKRFS